MLIRVSTLYTRCLADSTIMVIEKNKFSKRTRATACSYYVVSKSRNKLGRLYKCLDDSGLRAPSRNARNWSSAQYVYAGSLYHRSSQGCRKVNRLLNLYIILGAVIFHSRKLKYIHVRSVIRSKTCIEMFVKYKYLVAEFVDSW